MNEIFVMTNKEFFIKVVIAFMILSAIEKLIIKLYKKVKNKL